MKAARQDVAEASRNRSYLACFHAHERFEDRAVHQIRRRLRFSKSHRFQRAGKDTSSCTCGLFWIPWANRNGERSGRARPGPNGFYVQSFGKPRPTLRPGRFLVTNLYVQLKVRSPCFNLDYHKCLSQAGRTRHGPPETTK